MERAGLKPNEYTLPIILSAVLNTELKLLVPQIHARIICLALNASVFVGSALMKAYAYSGDGVGLSKAFYEILNKDVTSWNALISGHMELGCMHEAQKTFDSMPEKDVVSWTTLVNGYIRNKRIKKARSIFNKITGKNVISWTVMISGIHGENGAWNIVVKLRKMLNEKRVRKQKAGSWVESPFLEM
ncbi:hypothetical protein Pint_00827 [Pistacia integerrima]|uniref:Uncharacterized protein n=1 Tax=Pistacia integerrima TaxID=434235 RepID=A0ACC0ZRL1_9ROSI|nr:hypothetical protein Pint_00827 [Pistacia integerrima]